jgi:HEAT repeat protein
MKHNLSSVRLLFHRAFICLIIGCVVMLILTLIEALILALINPLSILDNTHNRLSALLSLPVHSPIYLLLPLGELLFVSTSTFFAVKPLAIYNYMRVIHHEQLTSNNLYLPISVPVNISLVRQQTSLVDVLQQRNAHLFLTGDPGSGKTLALCVYLYQLSQPSLAFALSPTRIPVYVSLKHYGLFLKNYQLPSENNTASPYNLFFQYLAESSLPGMSLLRPYLRSLFEHGQLLLLFDGFNEIDRADRPPIVDELVFLMRHTPNHLIIASREMDYHEQDTFAQLVDEGNAMHALIYPMQPDHVNELVESFVERQDNHWRYTAGQIIQLIERSRLRYHSRNPMMAFALLNSIDRVGIEQSKQIDTRGRLLREYVVQLFENESKRPQWRQNVPLRQEVFQLLSTIACAAYWANSYDAIQLPVTALSSLWDRRGKVDVAALAEAVGNWLDEHSPQLPFVAENIESAMAGGDYAQLLQFALSASLVNVTADGALSFPHELFAAYFVAEYCFTASQELDRVALTMRVDLLDDIDHWCQPIALWAGLLEGPLTLAECFGPLALLNRTYVPYALSLGLTCVGVVTTPPQADIPRTVILPPNFEKALSFATHDNSACEELAGVLTLCAESGIPEAYYALLPLLTVEGIDELLILLDQNAVPEILFQHLQYAVDHPDYETQVRRLTRILSRFGTQVVDQAAQLSLPAPERSLRLRAATINILGGTYDAQAVGPLVERLGDAEDAVVERAAHALFRLGPTLALASLLHTLEDRTPNVLTLRVHRAILNVLRRFMEEQDTRGRLSNTQYQQIVDHLLPILTPQYQFEPEIQLQARDLLVDQGRMASVLDTGSQRQRGQQVIDVLINYLAMQNDNAIRQVFVVLQEIGPSALPRLIASLHHQSELVRERVIEVMRHIHDLSALPALLEIVDDPSTAIRQQVADALRAFAPESIPGLVELVLTSANDSEAEAATQVLASIGNPVVDPVLNVLFEASPARARLLVHVLEQIHDPRAVPALITLQEQSQAEPLLAVTLVQTLGQFREKQVVVPLIEQVAATNPLLYEEAITALSQLGEIALPDLLTALAIDQEPVVEQRIQRAILGMSPFPGEQLVQALEQNSEAQAARLQAIFVQQGSDAAFVLAKHLLYPDEQVRVYIYQTLERMQDVVVVPALLDALYVADLREIAGAFLLKYPAVTISPLVDLLGEPERGNAAAVILSQFGPVILRPVGQGHSLLDALEDQRAMARELASRVIITLVRQSSDPQAILDDIVQLFWPPLPTNSREQLIDILTYELADVSIAALLAGLEDIQLIEPVTDALSRLAQRQNMQDEVIDNLIEALFVADRRRGSEEALIKISAPAVTPVGQLITEQDVAVARSAKRILCDIGVPALPFIWMAHSDKSNPQRRDAAMEVFRSMSADVIKDELVALLLSENRDDTAMAVSLLLERVHEENRQSYANHVMVPELIAYVESQQMNTTNLRIIALLLLLGEQAFFDHLLDAVEKTSQPRNHLLYIFLLLSDKSQQAILDTFEDPDTSNSLRAELATVLGLLKTPRVITDYAQRVSLYGLVKNHKQVVYPDKLAISLRALGGLLASGQWNTRRLLEMRDRCADDDPARELFNVLLGWRYEPIIAQIEDEMEVQRETFKKKALLMTERIMEEQQRAQGLETDLEKLKEEHGIRGDELQKVMRDRDTLRANISKLTKENTDLRSSLEQTIKARTALSTQLERAKRDYTILQQQMQQQQASKPTQ